MRSVILGTAGHVDHGKTVLVQALTGTNTDRWEEERRRGITIDLGFARFPTSPGGPEISVVDVPGHEDFIKNMLAGATGIDLLLLVVAADEGPMPQTREHLWIARLLGVERGVIAISKIDLVDAEWTALVEEAVREEVGRIFEGSDWPLVPVSAVTGEGVEELARTLAAASDETRVRQDDDLFRMPIDRVFTVKGVGTVVTGTVWSGTLEAGSEVRALPADLRARVRGIQVHGADVEAARSGQRAAVALVGMDRSRVERGDVLTTHDVWRATRHLDARVWLTPDSPWPMEHWQRVRFHLGTAEILGRVVLGREGRLAPGGSSAIQLRLEEPVVARAGDRFVLRFYSPVTTIGGGVVRDPWPYRRGRGDLIEASRGWPAEDAGRDARVESLLASRSDGASADELCVLAGLTRPELDVVLDALRSAGQAREAGGRWHARLGFEEARRQVLETLARSHAEETGAPGVSLESLRTSSGLPGEVINVAISELESEGAIRVEGAVAALSGHVPRLTPEQERLAAAVLERLRAAGLTPPSVKVLATGLGVADEDLLRVLKFLASEGSLVAVTADLYFDSGAIRDMKADLAGRLRDRGPTTPSEFRRILGVTRKHVIPLLEHLDAVGFTTRSPEGRMLRERR